MSNQSFFTQTRQPSAFENRVYQVLQTIPRGRVCTYQQLAVALNCNSAQAIGQALKRNPHAPRVPCHRVIRTDLSIGGYSGHTCGENLQKKIRLLAEEGVTFTAGRLDQPKLLWTPATLT
jgi:methylated-DNA-[protein]-cysteine S-methyltransferase